MDVSKYSCHSISINVFYTKQVALNFQSLQFQISIDPWKLKGKIHPCLYSLHLILLTHSKVIYHGNINIMNLQMAFPLILSKFCDSAAPLDALKPVRKLIFKHCQEPLASPSEISSLL